MYHIVDALQPEIVPEIIASISMRWLNTGSAQVEGSVLHNAVIKHNLRNFGVVFDELFAAQPKSLMWGLIKLRQSHRHAIRAAIGPITVKWRV